MNLSLTEGNMIATLKAAPGKSIAFPELSKRFDNSTDTEILALLWRMRTRQTDPVKFNTGWITVKELVVSLG